MRCNYYKEIHEFVYLLRTLSLLHVMDKLAFIAKTSLGGITTDASWTVAKSKRDCRSSLVNTFNSY